MLLSVLIRKISILKRVCSSFHIPEIEINFVISGLLELCHSFSQSFLILGLDELWCYP